MYNHSRRTFIQGATAVTVAAAIGGDLLRVHGDALADASPLANGSLAPPISYVANANGKTFVVANGQPYLMYGVQIRIDNLMGHDFSPANWALAAQYFQYASAAGFKTVIVPMAWSNVETSQGVYDFAQYVDQVIDNANAYNLTVQALWYGADACGYMFVPSYVSGDTVTYPRNAAYPEFLDLTGQNLINAETAALDALMNHIAAYDTNNCVIMVQVENEPDGSGSVSVTWGDTADMAAKMYAGGQFDAVSSLINTLGGVVHASNRNVVTRCNIGSSYRALDLFNARLPLGTGCDIFGVDSYSYTPAALMSVLDTIPPGTPGNVSHQPEGGGQYKNLINLILNNFQLGGSYQVYELRTIGQPYDAGIYQKTDYADPGTWLARTGKEKVPYSLTGASSSDQSDNSTSEVIAFNTLVYKADKKIALCTPGNCAAFNVNDVSGVYSEQRSIAGKNITFNTTSGGEAFAIQDTNGDLILMNLNNGSGFALDPSFVQMAEAPVGYYNASNVWVEQSGRAFTGNSLVMKKSEVIRLTANYVQNGGFESGLAGWTVTSVADSDACFIDPSIPHLGTNALTHYKATPYTVYTWQTITGLQNGVYTLKAWVVSSGGQITCQMKATGYGGADLHWTIAAEATYTRVRIATINVTNGTCTVGFYSHANAGNTLHVDDVALYRQS